MVIYLLDILVKSDFQSREVKQLKTREIAMVSQWELGINIRKFGDHCFWFSLTQDLNTKETQDYSVDAIENHSAYHEQIQFFYKQIVNLQVFSYKVCNTFQSCLIFIPFTMISLHYKT